MFVVRNTFTPDYDIKRNWSAWIGGAWDSREAAYASIADLDGTLNAMTEDGTDEVHAIQALLDDDTYDVRFNEAYRKWQHVHHDGLSCYPLDAEDAETALIEATENQDSYDWFGFGHQTLGTVRYVGAITDTLHVFECTDTRPESDY